MKAILISLVLSMMFIAGLVAMSALGPADNGVAGSNVFMVDGKQVVEINAKGGYSPRTSFAKAGVPTVLKMKTDGTFDCSAALMIPDVDYRGNLPRSGETMIDVPVQSSGDEIQGLCVMGMYSFKVKFE